MTNLAFSAQGNDGLPGVFSLLFPAVVSQDDIVSSSRALKSDLFSYSPAASRYQDPSISHAEPCKSHLKGCGNYFGKDPRIADVSRPGCVSWGIQRERWKTPVKYIAGAPDPAPFATIAGAFSCHRVSVEGGSPKVSRTVPGAEERPGLCLLGTTPVAVWRRHGGLGRMHITNKATFT